MVSVVIAAELRSSAARLAATSASPRLDAELLMAHALGISREAMLLRGTEEAVPVGFPDLLARRAAGEPIAYLTGRRSFWNIELEVDPSVLIPRPDSETLIDAAIGHFGRRGPATVLDLGTGSGALLLAALDIWPAAEGIGIDASAKALEVATANAARLGLAARSRFLVGDWVGTGATFDLVLCNPPYVASTEVLPADVAAHEPAAALFAGVDGLDAYRALAPVLGAQIAPGGIACVEIGSTQAATASALFARWGLRAAVHRDLAGRDRCLLLRT